jgi:hypothetical protein
MERYTVVYPRGQPGLPDDPVTVCQQLARYRRRPGSTTTWRARTMRQHDPTRECNVCVAPTSSSSEPESAPRHRRPTMGTARRARGGQAPTRRGADPSSPGAGDGPRASRLTTCTERSCAGAAPRGERRAAGAPPGCRTTSGPHADVAGPGMNTQQRPARQQGRKHRR